MGGIVDRDSLLRASAILDLLEIGWQPGKAELDAARYVQKWTIRQSDDGLPFQMIGIAWSLPVRCAVVADAVLALDRAAHWARLWNEWVVIGDPLKGSLPLDTDIIRTASAAWLIKELSSYPVSA